MRPGKEVWGSVIDVKARDTLFLHLPGMAGQVVEESNRIVKAVDALLLITPEMDRGSIQELKFSLIQPDWKDMRVWNMSESYCTRSLMSQKLEVNNL